MGRADPLKMVADYKGDEVMREWIPFRPFCSLHFDQTTYPRGHLDDKLAGSREPAKPALSRYPNRDAGRPCSAYKWHRCKDVDELIFFVRYQFIKK